MIILFSLLSGVFGLGMVVLFTGIRGGMPLPRLLPHRTSGGRGDRWVLRLTVMLGAGVGVGLVTGWLVGGLLAALAVMTLPKMLGPDRAHQAAVARAEAIAGWTEQLRDTLAGSAGIEQAITATAPVAPVPIRGQVAALAGALGQQYRLPDALTAFAEKVADPTADLVVAALRHASQHQAGRLGDQLGALAGVAREEVALRLRVAVTRARVRTSVRVIIATTLAMAAGLLAAGGEFLAPYDSPVGQLVLAVIGGLFAVALRWLERMSRLPTPRRVLAAEEVSIP